MVTTPAENLAAGQPIPGSIFTGLCWVGDCGRCGPPYGRLCECACHKEGK